MTVIPQHVSEFLDNYEGTVLATYPGPTGGSRMNSRRRTLRVSDVRALLNEIQGLKQAIADGPPTLTVMDAGEADELPDGAVLRDDMDAIWLKEPHPAANGRDWLKVGNERRLVAEAITYPAAVMSA